MFCSFLDGASGLGCGRLLFFHAHGDGNGRGGEGRDMLAAERRFRIFYFNLFYIIDELVMQ